MDDSERRGAAAPEGVSVRPAADGDAAAMRRIADVAYEIYVPRIGKKPVPMLADYPGVVRHGHTWVAEHAGQLVGFVVLEPAEDHLLVENIAVDPARQGLGIGGRLLAVAEDEARTLGLPELRLYTNEMMSENLGYYPRQGYRETHRAEQDGYRRVFFTKLLGESAAGAEPAEAEPEAAGAETAGAEPEAAGAEPAGRVVPGTDHP